MASTVAETRSSYHVVEGRSKVKRVKQTAEEGDWSVQPEDSIPGASAFNGRKETEVLSLPQSHQIKLPETKADAMTVEANATWRQTQQVSSTKNRKNGQRSRDTNGERKSRDSDDDQNPQISGVDAEKLHQMKSHGTTDLEQRRHGEKERNERNSDIGDSKVKDFESSKKKTTNSDLGHLKVPVSGGRRTQGSSSAVEFFSSAGSEPDTDGESEGGVSFLSAPETMPPKKPCRDTRNKMRFKKFFRPLHRSKNIGNSKESSSSSSTSSSVTSSSPSSSSSSTFLFFQKKENDRSKKRESIDTGCGSMEELEDKDIEDEEAKDKETSNKDKKKKSITTEMKGKLHDLRRRYTDLTTNQKDGKTEKPSTETIRSWSNAIEHLLADKFGLQCFHAFLKSEFSEENIDFWMSCESYKSLKPSKQPVQAQKIFAEYIAPQAPREINIDSVTRELTCSRMIQPDSTTFDAAQKRIQALMDKDSYPRFIQSTLYQDLVTGCSPLLAS